MNDFQERLADYIDSLDTGLPLFNDSNSEDVSIALYSLPGGKVNRQYYDGTVDKQLNYEIQAKTTLEQRDNVLNSLNLIGNTLMNLSELNSNNKTFKFDSITISSESYLSEATTEGYVYFRLEFQANITILEDD